MSSTDTCFYVEHCVDAIVVRNKTEERNKSARSVGGHFIPTVKETVFQHILNPSYCSQSTYVYLSIFCSDAQRSYLSLLLSLMIYYTSTHNFNCNHYLAATLLTNLCLNQEHYQYFCYSGLSLN